MWTTTQGPLDCWQQPHSGRYFNIFQAPHLLSKKSPKPLLELIFRNILGTKTLGDILAERETIAHDMQVSLDEATDPWGVYIERVEVKHHDHRHRRHHHNHDDGEQVKDVRVPEQLQRAMAAEAEAAREARAKVNMLM